MPNVMDVVKKYKDDRKITYHEFAKEVSRSLGKHDQVSINTVSTWGQGKYNPDYWMLVHLVMNDSGWIADFARDCLAVIKPEIWKSKVNM